MKLSQSWSWLKEGMNVKVHKTSLSGETFVGQVAVKDDAKIRVRNGKRELTLWKESDSDVEIE
jgi:hypothetical protein